jgi:hypothetical protein
MHQVFVPAHHEAADPALAVLPSSARGAHTLARALVGREEVGALEEERRNLLERNSA